MNSNIIFSLCSFIYTVLITIIYFTKKRIASEENKIYSIILCTTLIGLGIELSSAALIYFIPNSIITNYSFKLIMLYFFTWIFEFFIYIYYISKPQRKLKTNVIYPFYVLLALTTMLLPLHAKIENGITKYTYGPSVYFVYFISGIFIVGSIALMLSNFKHIKTKKYIPVFAFIGFGIIVAAVQAIRPELLLMSSAEAFITNLMYFTIENPDMQMMEELYKNKKLIEKSNQDTSNFLFRMTQDIKSPVKDIINISRDMTTMSNIEDLKENAKGINNLSNEIDYLINDALDVTSMNTKQIKVYDSRYNVINLFKELEYRFENELNGIKFNFEMSKVIPTYLYGDSIKLKQAIKSILNNALVHTKEGEITMTVSGLVKYGICRLMVSVTDTGGGISIEEVNNILSMSGDELSQIKLDNDNEKLTLKEVKKLLTLLGGNLMVKSEEDKGTTVSVVLDQKIVELKETEITKKLESYEQTLYRNKKVMVVDDDAKELAQITTWLENHDAEVNGSLFGRDCIEKISSHMKYDLILLDDETSTYSALEVLKELKQTKKFNIPVVVMINDNKEFIKLHYLQDGFADVIMKSKLESEINRIMKRF